MINLYGPVNNLGFGVHYQNMLKALMDNDVNVKAISVGQPQIDPFFESYIHQASTDKEPDPNNPSVFIFHEEYSDQAVGNPLATFCIFETDKLKTQSIDKLNNGPSNIVLVTSEKHKKVVESCINKPVKVVTEGIDECLYNSLPVDKRIDTGKFTYITVGKKEKRKYTREVLELFMATMRDKNVALICHSFNMFAHKIQDHPFTNLNCWSDINPIKRGFEYQGFDGKAHKFTHKDCDLYFSTPDIQVAEMATLYHSANLGIQLSRGEAFGLPNAELLACGIPVISNKCAGHEIYLENSPDIEQELLIDNLGTEPANDGIWFDGNQGNWSTVDISKLETILELTYIKQDKYKNKNEELASYMENNFSWNLAAKQLLDAINYTN